MKTFVRLAVALMAVTVVCQGSLAMAEDYYWASDGQAAAPAAAPAAQPKAPAAKPAAGTCCNQSSCCNEPSCCEQPSCGMCECCCEPRAGVVGLFGFDSFKGLSDGGRQSNFGAVSGFNSALLLPGEAGDRGLGLQLGASYGVYDWDGRAVNNSAQMQQQTFVTTGFFRKGDEDHPLSFGVVYDWMLNDNWGVYGTNPTLGQWRGQAEWALSDQNGVGMWGCLRDLGATSTVGAAAPVTVLNRGVSQADMFWHHKFDYPAQSWLWFGVPQNDRLNGAGSLYDWIIGAALQCPITDNFACYGNMEYAHPSAAAGTFAARDSAWDVGVGVVWYFGGGAHSHQLNGEKWMPYMPVANNSTFLVDQF